MSSSKLTSDTMDTVEATDVLTLMARFAVSVGGGSIKRTVTNANLTNAGLPEVCLEASSRDCQRYHCEIRLERDRSAEGG